jgi:hypothetical protein
VCSTERKYPTDKPWAFISPSAARTAEGRAQGLPCKSDTYFSNDAYWFTSTQTIARKTKSEPSLASIFQRILSR